MKKVGIIGGSGFTGGELIRLILGHPALEIDFVYSTTREGQPIADTHTDLTGRIELNFTHEVNTDIEVLFLCLGHGNSAAFLQQYPFDSTTLVIDLSNDFRLHDKRNFGGRDFVYGLPEVNRNAIEAATAIANPGCFATAIQLALYPLAKNQELTEAVHINATTGSTGAGVGLSATTHFTWRNNNLSWYKPFTHQHLDEINETLSAVQPQLPALHFLPQRGDFTRGIFATAYTPFKGSLDEAKSLYHNAYENAPFTHLIDQAVHLKMVVNTNNCFIHLHQHNDLLLVTAVIDNLVKGASGQALQNMNLIFGWEETLGLNLKPNIF